MNRTDRRKREVRDRILEAAFELFLSQGGLHDTFLELVKDGVARGEVSARRDPEILADLIVGALVVSIVNWTIDKTYCLETGLRDSAAALGELLTSDPPRS